jgi:hypothetical protein
MSRNQGKGIRAEGPGTGNRRQGTDQEFTENGDIFPKLLGPIKLTHLVAGVKNLPFLCGFFSAGKKKHA